MMERFVIVLRTGGFYFDVMIISILLFGGSLFLHFNGDSYNNTQWLFQTIPLIPVAKFFAFLAVMAVIFSYKDSVSVEQFFRISAFFGVVISVGNRPNVLNIFKLELSELNDSLVDVLFVILAIAMTALVHVRVKRGVENNDQE